MGRNMNKSYIEKLMNTVTPNGYKFDLLDYVCNPSLDYDYPNFGKILEQREDGDVIRTVRYFKHYNGGGHYEAVETFVPKPVGDNPWVITRELSCEHLSDAPRFNLKTLLSYC